eukprot:6199380-Pleurochrysis_carterae.AAC.2
MREQVVVRHLTVPVMIGVQNLVQGLAVEARRHEVFPAHAVKVAAIPMERLAGCQTRSLGALVAQGHRQLCCGRLAHSAARSLVCPQPLQWAGGCTSFARLLVTGLGET